MSLLALAPLGQHMSLLALSAALIGVCVQRALHALALPSSASTVHALLSLQSFGHRPSQRSPGSTIPFPHIELQSGSEFPLAPLGQHMSLKIGTAIITWVQTALQFLALPSIRSVVHTSESTQLVGHGNEGWLGSQISPGPITPSPQLAEQSASLP